MRHAGQREGAGHKNQIANQNHGKIEGGREEALASKSNKTCHYKQVEVSPHVIECMTGV